MCAPISVATGGGTGCTGVCQYLPKIIGLASMGSVFIILSFKGWLKRGLSSLRKTA